MSVSIALNATYEEAEAVARGWVPVLAVEPGMALILGTVRPTTNWSASRWTARDLYVEYTAPRGGPAYFVLHATIGPHEPDAIDAAAFCLGDPWNSYAERELRRREDENDVIRNVLEHITVNHWTHLYAGLHVRVAIKPPTGAGGLVAGAFGYRPLADLGRWSA